MIVDEDAMQSRCSSSCVVAVSSLCFFYVVVIAVLCCATPTPTVPVVGCRRRRRRCCCGCFSVLLCVPNRLVLLYDIKPELFVWYRICVRCRRHRELLLFLLLLLVPSVTTSRRHHRRRRCHPATCFLRMNCVVAAAVAHTLLILV